MLCGVLVEQDVHEHMSNEYKDRYIVIVLPKLASLGQSGNTRDHQVVVVVFFTLTDRASTIPSNTRGCQTGTGSAGQKKIRGKFTELQ